MAYTTVKLHLLLTCAYFGLLETTPPVASQKVHPNSLNSEPYYVDNTAEIIKPYGILSLDGTNAVANATHDNLKFKLWENIHREYVEALKNEDVDLSIEELIGKYEYPFEEHEVVTEDGYILNLFRIPGNGSVVFVMHGLFGSADDFIVTGPDSGLAYLLSKDGYDVWLGNARGNKHSHRHISLDPSEPIFWEFSWHEIGYYDLPAMIDYTLNITNKKSLYYIGHSQGTTSFFVMSSLKPEYNKKIDHMMALAPSAYMEHAKSSFLRLLSPMSNFLQTLLYSYGFYELFPYSPIMRMVKSVMCDSGPLSGILCNEVMMYFGGYNFAELNATNLAVILGHVPSGAAVKQVIHYLQAIVSKKFRQFDHGADANMKKYGRETPPSYPLKKVTASVSLFHSDNDVLSATPDVYKLRRKLSNCIDVKLPSKYSFSHLDIIWGKDFKSVIYSRIIKLLRTFA